MPDLPPYTWRADGGYRPSPSSDHRFWHFPSQPTAPLCVQQQHVTLCPPYSSQYPLMCATGPFQTQQCFVLPSSPPSKPKKQDETDKENVAPAKESADKKKEGEAKKQSGQKGEVKTNSKTPENPDLPPRLRAGTNYMFPREHTKLHIFNKAAPVWEAKYNGQSLHFKIFTVSTHFTVAMVIENVLRKSGDEVKGWAVSEAIERGDGVWSKGTTIEYGTDKAKAFLVDMGWNVKRGDSLPPVWVTVHKMAGKKKK